MDRLPTLFTDRLVLTPLQLQDAPIIQELFPQWEVVRYLDRRVPWPTTRPAGSQRMKACAWWACETVILSADRCASKYGR